MLRIFLFLFYSMHYRFKARMKNHTEIPVYNYVYDKNNLTWGKYMNSVRRGLHEPLNKTVW